MNRIYQNTVCTECQNSCIVERERKIVAVNVTRSRNLRLPKCDLNGQNYYKIDYFKELEPMEIGGIDICLTCVRKAENNYRLRKIGGYLYG